MSQRRPRVEHYTRQGEEWVLRELDGLARVVQLPDIGCELPLTEIYDKVTFIVADAALSRSDESAN